MKFERHVAIGPWTRCVFEACIFDNYQEFRAAQALDRTESVVWWARNDPAVFVIPTPVGGFEPDFLYVRSISHQMVHGALEIKGDFLWRSPEQPDRIKAQAALEWVNKANEISPDEPWEIAVVSDQEAKAATVLKDLLNVPLLYGGPS
jgi:Endonuclease domain